MAMTMAIESNVEEKLGRFGLTEDDVERLVEALGTHDGHARRVVRGALRELGEAAVPALEKAASGSEATVSREAMKLLRQIRL